MLSALFSFEGRMGRLRYLGWSIASMFVVAIFGAVLSMILVFGFARLMRGMTPDQIVHLPVFWITISLFLIVLAWPGFALAAKRLRDIGLAPLVWIPIFLAFLAMDHLLIAPFLHASLVKGTIVGSIFTSLSGFFLLLMPGRDNDDRPDLSYLAPEIERMRQQAQADFQIPAPATIPARIRPQNTGQRTEFGRRR